MNGSYYQTPVFINDINRDTENIESNFSNQSNQYNMEQSYIENILRNKLNLNK